MADLRPHAARPASDYRQYDHAGAGEFYSSDETGVQISGVQIACHKNSLSDLRIFLLELQLGL
ncbi:hypothetical protein ACO0LH_00190 [Undibacterium sp. TJN19]